MEDVGLHDLRRTCASYLAMAGENLPTIQHVLEKGTTTLGTRRMSAEKKIQLLERIVKDRMAGVITPAEANKMTKTVNML
ncbi:MAG: hypothetical protein ABIU05_09905 [Nitrospirales bacterium]